MVYCAKSDTSYYRKLVSDNKFSYSEWSNKCTGEFVKHILLIYFKAKQEVQLL